VANTNTFSTWKKSERKETERAQSPHASADSELKRRMSSSSVKLKTINRRTREPKRASRQRSRREQRPKRFARTLFAHSRKGKRLLVPRSKLRPLPNSSSQLLQLASLYSRDQAKRSNKLDRSKQTLKPLLPNHSHIPSLFPSSKKQFVDAFTIAISNKKKPILFSPPPHHQ
jgi:hypothetical protein